MSPLPTMIGRTAAVIAGLLLVAACEPQRNPLEPPPPPDDPVEPRVIRARVVRGVSGELVSDSVATHQLVEPILVLVQERELVLLEPFEELVPRDPLERILSGESGEIDAQNARIIEVAFLEWSGVSAENSVHDGADSFVVCDGRIRYQTIHYSVA